MGDAPEGDGPWGDASGSSPSEGDSADAGALPADDAFAGIAARMNDVSILFPLPSSAADIDHLLAPSATGSLGALFPSEVYASMGPITGGTEDPFPDVGEPHETFAAYGALRVVAMRIDPCFASLDPAPLGIGCTAQIRLVFQEVTWNPYVGDAGATNAFDSALHAFYNLPRAQFLALARALVELRVANENGDMLAALAPHPIMARQGLAGAMSQGVQRLILGYAGEQNLVRTARSSLAAPGFASEGVWDMAAFDVMGAPFAATPRSIPTLIDAVDGGSVFGQGIFGGLGNLSFTPTTTSADNFTALYTISEAANGAHVGTVSASDRQAALDALVRVENPKDNSAKTIDCASCHVATDTERNVAISLLSFDDVQSPLAFQPDGTNVTPSDMAATFISGSGPFGVNVHVFSYVGTLPTIGQRVVNETAAVVEYLNGPSH